MALAFAVASEQAYTPSSGVSLMHPPHAVCPLGLTQYVPARAGDGNRVRTETTSAAQKLGTFFIGAPSAIHRWVFPPSAGEAFSFFVLSKQELSRIAARFCTVRGGCHLVRCCIETARPLAVESDLVGCRITGL